MKEEREEEEREWFLAEENATAQNGTSYLAMRISHDQP